MRRSYLEEQVQQKPKLLFLIEENQQLKHKLFSFKDQLQQSLRQQNAMAQSLQNSEKYIQALQQGNQKHRAAITTCQNQMVRLKKQLEQKRCSLGQKDNQIFRLNLLIANLTQKSKSSQDQQDKASQRKQHNRKQLQEELFKIKQDLDNCVDMYRKDNIKMKDYQRLILQLQQRNGQLTNQADKLSSMLHQYQLRAQHKDSSISDLILASTDQISKHNQMAKTVLQYQARNSSLQSQNSQLLRQLSRFTNKAKKVQHLFDLCLEFRIDGGASKLREQHQVLKQEVYRLRQEIKRLKQYNQLSEEKKSYLFEENSKLRSQRELIQEESEQLRKNLQYMIELQEHKTSELNLLKDQLKQQKQEYELKFQAVANKICELDQIQSELSQKQERLQMTEMRNHELQNQLLRYQNSISSRQIKYNNQLKKVLNQLQRFQKREKSLQQQNSELKLVIDKCQEELKRIELRVMEDMQRKLQKQNIITQKFRLDSFLNKVEDSIKSKGPLSSRSNQSKAFN